jgi:hypothetical protein
MFPGHQQVVGCVTKDAPGRWAVRQRKLDAPYRLLSALGAFCLWEFRVFSTNLNILRAICSVHRYPAQRAGDTFCPRSDRFRLLELRVSRTGRKPLRGGKGQGPARRRWISATHATRTLFSPSLNEPLHGGNVPVTRRACVGLALLSPRVTSGLAKPPLLPRHSIHVSKQTACRLAASFKKPVPERPQWLAVKP